MTMKKNPQIKLLIWCGIPFVLGIFTAFFKSKIVNVDVDYITGFLSPKGESMMLILYALIAACLAIFVAMSFLTGAKELSFGEKAISKPHKIILVTSGMLFIVSCGFLLYQSQPLEILTIISALFLAASGIAQISSLKTVSPVNVGLCRLFPLFFTGLYLLMFYRLNARNPLVYNYVLEILAIIALLYCLYCIAGTYFTKPRPKALIISAAAATYMVTGVVALHIFSPTFCGLYISFGMAECFGALACIFLIWAEVFRGLAPEKK